MNHTYRWRPKTALDSTLELLLAYVKRCLQIGGIEQPARGARGFHFWLATILATPLLTSYYTSYTTFD